MARIGPVATVAAQAVKAMRAAQLIPAARPMPWLRPSESPVPHFGLRPSTVMIDLYYWTTPNGHKITVFLEESGLDYRVHPVNIGKGEQFAADFLRIAPNNRIPAIVDHAPADGSAPLSLFESGAILLYLAEKTGRFIPADLHGRADVLQWLFWQMGGLGPMAGQNNHFANAAPEKLPYAIERYVKETSRLYGVLDRRLADRDYIAGDYSIADMASYPWVVPYRSHGQDLGAFPNLERWFRAVEARPAVQRAYALAREINPPKTLTPEEEAAQRKVLYGQDAGTVRR
jgi:GST-like protein